jgi:hypothetical protein
MHRPEMQRGYGFAAEALKEKWRGLFLAICYFSSK